jgi:Calx-beta domain
VKGSAARNVGRILIALTVAAATGGVLVSPAAATAVDRVSSGQTCQPGTTYSRIRMNPQPIATFGSLQAGQTASVFAQPLNGNQCLSGATFYISVSAKVSGDSFTVQQPSMCGGTSLLSSKAVACTTDLSGKVYFWYTTPSTIPDHGTAELTTSSQSSQGSSAHAWYLYETVYRFSASPIAHSGSLAAGQTVAETLQAAGVGGTPAAGAAVFLSFKTTASGSGSASVGATKLTTSPTSFTADSNGQVQLTYTAPAVLPTNGVDTIYAASSTSASPSVFNSTSYAFAAGMPTVSVGDVSQVEGDHPGPTENGTLAQFDVALSAPQTAPVTVQYLTDCGVGDKTCQEDYLQTLQPNPRTITIPAGQTSALINVVIYSYVASEPYVESFFVQLLNASGSILGRTLGSGTILGDDETTTAETLYIGDVGVVRGISGNQVAVFTVTLAAPSNTSVTFQYTTAPGTGIPGTDYMSVSGTATIVPGSTSAHLQVPILPATSPGSTLTYTLTVSSPSGATITRATGTGSILNLN